MNVLESVLAGVVGIVGLVIFYTVYNTYSACLGASAPLVALVPIAIASGIIIFVLVRSFSGR
jgi:hypothetical protein